MRTHPQKTSPSLPSPALLAGLSLLLASGCNAVLGLEDDYQTGAAGGQAGASGAGSGQGGGSGGSLQGGSGQAGRGGAGQGGAGQGGAGAGGAGAGGAGQGAGQGGAGQGGSAGGLAGGGQGGAGAGGQGGTGAAGSGGGGGVVIYVDPSAGKDLAIGTSPSAPVQSLLRAEEIASSLGPQAKEIRACIGVHTLTKTLTIPPGVVLRGGFDCATFSQQYESAGASDLCESSVFLPTNATRIQGKGAPLIDLPGGGGLQQVWLTAESQAVRVGQQPAVVERNRLELASAQPPEGPTVVASVLGGEHQILKNCILGGAGKALSPGEFASVGVSIVGGSTALVEENKIHGGEGDGGAVGHGSAALYVVDSSPRILSNTIEGGKGKSLFSVTDSALGSGGVVVRASASAKTPVGPTIQKNQISGGNGNGPSNQAIRIRADEGSPGLQMQGASAIEQNDIRGYSLPWMRQTSPRRSRASPPRAPCTRPTRSSCATTPSCAPPSPSSRPG